MQAPSAMTPTTVLEVMNQSLAGSDLARFARVAAVGIDGRTASGAVPLGASPFSAV